MASSPGTPAPQARSSVYGGVRIPRPSECFPSAVELFRRQQHLGFQHEPSLQSPVAERPPPTPSPHPDVAQIPTALHSASATAHREHQRWTRRAQRTSHQSNGTLPVTQPPTPFHSSGASLAQRLKQKFQRMAQRAPAHSVLPPSPVHPSVAQEFNNHVRTALLCVLARSLQIPVPELARSPALHSLLQPYMQRFQQTPTWMQFGGLLLAKKCEQMCIQAVGGTGAEPAAPDGRTEPTVSGRTENTGHWISLPMTAESTIPETIHSSVYALTPDIPIDGENCTPLPPPEDTNFEFSFRDPNPPPPPPIVDPAEHAEPPEETPPTDHPAAEEEENTPEVVEDAIPIQRPPKNLRIPKPKAPRKPCTPPREEPAEHAVVIPPVPTQQKTEPPGKTKKQKAASKRSADSDEHTSPGPKSKRIRPTHSPLEMVPDIC